jgi:hypothetical protein
VVAAMQCLVCGEEMRVVKIDPHVIDMQGFETRTFRCVGCGDVEKRQVFDNSRAVQSDSTKPPAAPESTAPAFTSKMRSILGGLVRLRGSPHS